MKKQILNIGKALNRAEQKLINGGTEENCQGHRSNCMLNPTEEFHKCCKHLNLRCKQVSGKILGICVRKEEETIPL